MQVEVVLMFIPIVATISVFVMIIFVRKYENLERMAMIEKGVKAEDMNLKPQRNASFPLRTSLLLIGSGLGILLGYILDITFNMQEPGYFSMILIFGGGGLGLAYLVEEKKYSKEGKFNS
jgi:hypothetical protein